MKKLIITIGGLLTFTLSSAQSVPVQKDTLKKLDSTQIKTIQKMPMDTIPDSKSKLIKDSLDYKRTIEDADTKKSKSPTPKYKVSFKK